MFTASGRELKSWEWASSGKFLGEGSWTGNRRIAVGFMHQAEPGLANSLAVFDSARGFSRPIWTRKIEDHELPPAYREQRRLSSSQVDTVVLLIDEIFPESPGQEIVLVHRYFPLTLSALRIYSERGELLYQLWQDTISHCAFWMKGAGLLVLGGVEGKFPLEARGFEGIEAVQVLHPTIFYAIRPALGFIDTEGMDERPRSGADEHPHHPVWLRCVVPPAWRDTGIYVIHMLPTRVHDRERSVQLHLEAFHIRPGGHTYIVKGGIELHIDEFGNELPGTRIMADNYRRAHLRGELPPPDYWRFDDLPPPRPPYRDDPPRFTPPEFWAEGPPADAP